MITISTYKDLEADAFIKCLLSIVAISTTKTTPASIQTKLPEWVSEATPFVARFGLNKKSFNKLMTDVQNSVDWKIIAPTVTNFFKVLETKNLEFSTDPMLYPPQPAFIRVLSTFFSDPTQGFRQIETLVPSLNEETLSDTFTFKTGVTDVDNLATLQTNLIAIIKEITGKKHPGLELTEQELKNATPEDAARFSSLETAINKLYPQVITFLCKKRDVKNIPVLDVLSYLKQKNVLINKFPVGFVGNVDDKMTLYTFDGVKIDGNPGTKQVFMNPRYDGTDFYFKTGDTKYYPVTVKKIDREQPAEVELFLDVKDKWRSDLKTVGPQRFACFFELAYTLCVDPSTLVQVPLEKDGQIFRLKIKGKRYSVAPSENSFIRKAVALVIEVGKDVTAEDLQKYLKSMNEEATFEAIKEMRASELASAIIQSSERKQLVSVETSKDLNTWFDIYVVKEVAKMLSKYSDTLPTVAEVKSLVNRELVELLFLAHKFVYKERAK